MHAICCHSQFRMPHLWNHGKNLFWCQPHQTPTRVVLWLQHSHSHMSPSYRLEPSHFKVIFRDPLKWNPGTFSFRIVLSNITAEAHKIIFRQKISVLAQGLLCDNQNHNEAVCFHFHLVPCWCRRPAKRLW